MTREDTKTASIVIERTLNAPITKVWKAITNNEDMKKWYFDIAEFKPEPGFEFRFSAGEGNQQYVHICKITEVVPNKKLAYTWKYEIYPVETIVTFELFEEGENKTRIRLTHEGVEKFPQDNKDFRRESFTNGWEYIIGTSLKEYVERS